MGRAGSRKTRGRLEQAKRRPRGRKGKGKGGGKGKSSQQPSRRAAELRQRAKNKVDRYLARHTNLTQTRKGEYRAADHAVLNQMTPAGLERVNRNVRGYRFFPDLESLSSHCVPRYATLPASLKRYARVIGAYNLSTNEIELNGGGRGPAGQVFTTQDRFAHELGHGIDGPHNAISSRPDWRDAWASEIRPHPPNPNAAANPHEGFTAFAAMVYGTNADRAMLERTYPSCVRVWKACRLW